jgi:cytochrome c peroxidase
VKENAMTRIKRALTLTALAVALTFGFITMAEAQRHAPPDDGTQGGVPGEPVLTPQQLLGQFIFYDTSLSAPKGESCATCHEAGAGWADARSVLDPTNLPTSEGAVHDRFGRRNSPTVAYGASIPPFLYDALTGSYIGGRYWDGRAHSPIDQAKATLLDRLEMNNLRAQSVVRAVHNSSYAGKFEALYGPVVWNNDALAFDHIAECLAAFQASHVMNRFNSRYDRSREGDPVALSPTERAGQALFEGRGTCIACHSSQARPDGGRAMFTNFRYYNLGVPKNPRNPFYDMPPAINPAGPNYIDLGLGGVLGVASENGKFKVPSLRNVSATPPYTHNGVFTTLYDVVMFHNTRDVDSRWGPPEVPTNVAIGAMTAGGGLTPEGPTIPPDPGEDTPRGEPGRLGHLKLSNLEVAQIVAFLETLRDAPASP